VLLEPEGLEILSALGIATPAFVFVSNSREIDKAILAGLGSKVVIKVVSSQILHKTDVGGVRIVANDRESIASGIDSMERTLCEYEISGFTIGQYVNYDARLGGELLLGLRWTDDFGPVVTLGPGGIYTEFLSRNLKAESDVAIISPETSDASMENAIEHCAVTRLMTTTVRGCPPRLDRRSIADVLERFMALARGLEPGLIHECEINPLVVSEGKLVALDVLIKLGTEQRLSRPDRPIAKLKNLLEPRSVAVIGVSEKLNPGHIIINNLIREGFERERIYIIKPNYDSIEGCRCYPDISSLPERIDLLILAISAAQIPGSLEQIIDLRKAESVIVIPGGLEEKSGGDALASSIRSKLAEVRSTDWRGPVINGGNCLGIRSRPGRYDTMFIPDYKLPRKSGAASPVAIISQSGAFAISRSSKLSSISPRYSISLGNQIDLTVGDYLTYLKDDPEIDIFGVYVEGFTKLDGVAFLKAVRKITSSGRTVILYRAGRTTAGAKASSSHTASIAGDYAVTRELSKSAGAIVAETFEDFEDLLLVSTLLRDKQVGGLQLGAISNAGFECVAIADNLGSFTLPNLLPSTTARLEQLMKTMQIDSIVDAHNPLDLTPMMDDAAFEEAVRVVMADDNIDVGVIGCVPLTVALNTLSAGYAHDENVFHKNSIGLRLAKLSEETRKAWVAIVDAGELYDPMARLLQDSGVPTFRTADRALRVFSVYCGERLKSRCELAIPAGVGLV